MSRFDRLALGLLAAVLAAGVLDMVYNTQMLFVVKRTPQLMALGTFLAPMLLMCAILLIMSALFRPVAETLGLE